MTSYCVHTTVRAIFATVFSAGNLLFFVAPEVEAMGQLGAFIIPPFRRYQYGLLGLPNGDKIIKHNHPAGLSLVVWLGKEIAYDLHK